MPVVERRRTAAMKKLNVRSRAELARVAALTSVVNSSSSRGDEQSVNRGSSVNLIPTQSQQPKRFRCTCLCDT